MNLRHKKKSKICEEGASTNHLEILGQGKNNGRAVETNYDVEENNLTGNLLRSVSNSKIKHYISAIDIRIPPSEGPPPQAIIHGDENSFEYGVGHNTLSSSHPFTKSSLSSQPFSDVDLSTELSSIKSSSHPFSDLSSESSSSGMDLIVGSRAASRTESDSFQLTTTNSGTSSGKMHRKMVSFAHTDGSYDIPAAPWRFESRTRLTMSSLEDKHSGLMKRMRSVAPWSRSFDSSDDEEWNKRVRDDQLVLGDLRTMPSLPMINIGNDTFESTIISSNGDESLLISTYRDVPLTSWKSDESSESDFAGMWRQWLKKKEYDIMTNTRSCCAASDVKSGWTMIDEEFWSGG